MKIVKRFDQPQKPLCFAARSAGAGQPICAGMGKLLPPAQLHASLCAAALFLGATDAKVPAGATTDQRVWVTQLAGL